MTAHSSNRVGANPPTGKELGFADSSWGLIFCRSGILAGWFPIAGLRVGEVRAVLSRLLHIDPEAKAVLNQRVLSDDDIIGDGVECLNFVKTSSIMG